jgi:hypothetical protein
MTGVAPDDDQDKPLDPAVERVRRRLVRFVAINLGLLFVALMAVVVAIVYRAGSSAPDSRRIAAQEGEPVRAAIEVPAGARVVGEAVSADRLLLRLALPDGGTVLIVHDLATGRLVGEFTVSGAR